MRRTRFSTLLLATTVLLLPACGGRTDQAGAPTTTTPPAERPAATPTTATDPDATPTAEPEPDPGGTGADAVTAFFARAGDGGAWVEPETHALDEPTRGVAGAALRELVAGATRDPNLRTLAPAGTQVRGVDIADGILVVDLSGAVRDGAGGSAQEETFAQQLAHTAAQFDGVHAVRLWVDGQPVSELWGHVDWSRPIAPDPHALVPVDILEPEWGQEVPVGALTVRGEATTFEAHVDLRLIAPDGSVAEESFETSSAGGPARGTWSHTFTIPAAGRWTVEAIEPDPSGGAEGRSPFRTRVEVDAR